MKTIVTLKSFPDHKGIPGHQGGSLPRDVTNSAGIKDANGNEVVGTLANRNSDNLYKISDAKDFMKEPGTIIVSIHGKGAYYSKGYQEHFWMIDAIGRGENEDSYVRFRIMPNDVGGKGPLVVYAQSI